MKEKSIRSGVSLCTALVACSASTRGQCPTSGLSGSWNGWPSGTSIVVYFNEEDGSFSSEAVGAVCSTESGDACTTGSAWGLWNEGLDSGFDVWEDIEPNLDNLPAHNYHLVEYGDTSTCGENQDACTQWNTQSNRTFYAWTNVTTSAPGNALWPELMAHEIGHTFGLSDCGDCSNPAMAYPVGEDNPDGPTGCDVEAIWNADCGYGSEFEEGTGC